MFIECQMTLVMTIELWHQIINYQAAQDKWSVLREGPVHWYKLSGITVDPTDLMVLVPSYHIQPHYSTATASSVLAPLIEIHTIYIALMIGPMRDRLSDHVTTSQSSYWLAIDLIDTPALNIDNCVNNLLQHIARPHHSTTTRPVWLAGLMVSAGSEITLLICFVVFGSRPLWPVMFIRGEMMSDIALSALLSQN